MSTGDYVVGVVYFLPTSAAALGAALLLTRRHYGHLRGLQRALAFSVLATAALILAHVIPAALGILARGSALLTALALLTAAWLITRNGPAPQAAGDAAGAGTPAREPPPSRAPQIAIAAVALAALTVYELARLRVLATQPLTFIDMTGFHMPGVARWIQTGTLWRVDQFEPGFATAQYPDNGDFLILSTVLPWHDLAFARVTAVVFFGLTGLAIYALALELGASRAAGVTFAAAALAVPAVSKYALEGLPDDITLATLTIGVLLLVRHARTRNRSELLLGGLALGLSLGTKWFGLTAVAAIAVAWLLAWLVARAPRAWVARATGMLLGAIALGGGFWLVRNIVESGDPLYPKAIRLAGVQLFAGSHHDVVDTYGYTILHYLGKPHILRTFIYPGFRDGVGLTGIALLLGLAAAIVRWAVVRRRAADADRTAGATLLAVALATLGICLVYSLTPGSAYGPPNFPVEAHTTLRWLTPAIVLGGAVAAAAASSLPRAGIVLELLGLAGVADGIVLGPSVATNTAVAIAAVIVAVGGLLFAAHRPGGFLRGRRPARGPALAAGVLAALVVLAVARLDQRSFDRHTYARFDPAYAYVDASAPSGHRIGVTGVVGTSGVSGVLPFFGPRLGNRVALVGDLVGHTVDAPSSLTAFRRELRAGRYDLLMIGLRDPGHTDEWARTLGYRLLVRGGRIAVYGAPPGAA